MLGGVLADPVLGVHQRGDLGDVGAAVGVGDAGDLRGPRNRRERDQGAEPVSDPGVDDAGHVAGAGQIPFGDRVGYDLPGVQASSAPRRVRHSHRAWWPGSRRCSGGRAARIRSR